ncbi:hypothetical protein BgiBS90_029908 [Biomphalaria glabrata]|nr:hypothetical protein BgiBS90_029908 [Biomphalaria glabrata]
MSVEFKLIEEGLDSVRIPWIMHTNELLIAFILGYWLLRQTAAFLFPNMSKGSSTQEVTEFCYSDGYIPGQDVITVNGRVYPMMSEIEIPPLSVYVKSETDDSKQLVCVLDFLIPSSVSCVLEKETKKAGDPDPSKIMYKFNIIVRVAPDWNNCRLIIEHRTKDAPWDYISSVIRVHPLPLLKIKINGAQLNAHRCRFGTDVGSELLVVFCVENLQAPRLEVSWENEHGVIEENGCITRNLKHTKADEWLQFVFLDNCHNDGSISCRIVDKESNLVNIVNETVTPKMDEPTETESDTSDYSWILFMLPLLISSLFALAGLLCFALSYRGKIDVSDVL